MSVEGKIAVVTGGSNGLGKATSLLLAQRGAAKVIVADIKPLTYEASNVEWYQLDITDVTSCKEFAEYLQERYGRIDILINNAGITNDALTVKMTDEQWDNVLEVNLKGTFYVTRVIIPIMESKGKGSIINISSVSGLFGNIGQANYTATKAGLIGLTRTWAKEFARKGANIRVNCISPGFMQTDPIRAWPDELKKKFANMTMLHRLGEPDEVAKAAAFLASDEASYITGQTLCVDGGMRL